MGFLLDDSNPLLRAYRPLRQYQNDFYEVLRCKPLLKSQMALELDHLKPAQISCVHFKSKRGPILIANLLKNALQ